MTDFDHRFATVGNITYHWVEAGSGEPVVLLHGIPESWQCWRHQMPTLSSQFRTIAFDLKGYGQSDKADGDYSMTAVAGEILAVLDHLGVGRFRLAGHDWGVAVADNICGLAPERVQRYARMCLALHNYDPRNSPQHGHYAKDQADAVALMARTEAYVRTWFRSSCKADLLPGEEELREIAREFAYPGVAQAVPRYFRDIRKSRKVDYAKLTMPVLCIQGEFDPRQPIEYSHGMDKVIPGFQGVMLLDAGHFVTRERPAEVTDALMFFFNSLLPPGHALFDRTRAHGLPTRPTREPEEWFGVHGMGGESEAKKGR